MSLFGKKRYKKAEQGAIQELLKQNPPKSSFSERVGPGRQKVLYVEAWKLINLANEIFGFNGWSHSVTQQTIDYVDFTDEKYYVGVSSLVKVTLKDGTSHEDVGYGIAEGFKSKGHALEKARKEAATDALKRTFRTFGNALGNSVTNKKITDFFHATCNSPAEVQQQERTQREALNEIQKIRSHKKVKRKLENEFQTEEIPSSTNYANKSFTPTKNEQSSSTSYPIFNTPIKDNLEGINILPNSTNKNLNDYLPSSTGSPLLDEERNRRKIRQSQKQAEFKSKIQNNASYNGTTQPNTSKANMETELEDDICSLLDGSAFSELLDSKPLLNNDSFGFSTSNGTTRQTSKF